MKLSDQLRTGWRNLTRQKLRSGLTVFAIVIGAIAVTVMLSLVTSAQGFLTDQFTKTGEIKRVIVTTDPTLSYREAQWGNSSGDTSKKITDETVARVEKITNVAHASPTFVWQGWSSGRVEGGADTALKNTNTFGYVPNGAIRHEVLAGRDLDPSDGTTGVVVTQTLADDLGFSGRLDSIIGKQITFQPRQDMGPQQKPSNEGGGKSGDQLSGAGIEPASFAISGVVASEDRSVFVTMDEMRTLTMVTRTNSMDQNGQQQPQTNVQIENQIAQRGYASIYLDVDEKKNVDGVVTSVRTLGLGAAAGKEEVTRQQSTFTIIGAVLGGLGGIALFVAAIGVINTMVMATLERTREIGIMRALGATKKTIRRLFTVEAAFLGFLGGLIGVILSFGFAVLLNAVMNDQLKDSGVSARNVVSVPIVLALLVILGTTLIGMVAGGLPARRAANLDPVQALRHE